MPSITTSPATGAFHGSIVAAHNDRFRSTFGTDPAIPGRIVVTSGVDALPARTKALAVYAVRVFAEFTEDNDPFGLHDFGLVSLPEGDHEVRLYWKIDLYDPAYAFGSEAPDDPARTRRVLTLLLPEEW